MTEAEARAALRAFAATERSEEAVIAAVPWRASADGGGWTVDSHIRGRVLRLEPEPGGLRIVRPDAEGWGVSMFVPATFGQP